MKNLQALLAEKKQVEENVLFTESRIEDLTNEIQTAKSDLLEKINNYNAEILRIKKLNLSKIAIANRIENVRYEINDAKEDSALVIRDYTQDIASEKRDLKRYAKQLVKLEQDYKVALFNKLANQ